MFTGDTSIIIIADLIGELISRIYIGNLKITLQQNIYQSIRAVDSFKIFPSDAIQFLDIKLDVKLKLNVRVEF